MREVPLYFRCTQRCGVADNSEREDSVRPTVMPNGMAVNPRCKEKNDPKSNTLLFQMHKTVRPTTVNVYIDATWP